MLTKVVWFIKILKSGLGLLIFCGGADVMPFSTCICRKKAFLSRTERFGTFLFCFFYRQSRPPRAQSLQNGGLSFLPSWRKIELVTTHKMASHPMDINIIFQENMCLTDSNNCKHLKWRFLTGKHRHCFWWRATWNKLIFKSSAPAFNKKWPYSPAELPK